MGGRFGKYGDFKRKERIRRNRPLRKHVNRLKYLQRKGKGNRIKLQSKGKLNVSICIKP